MTISGDHVRQLEGLIAALGSQGAAARLLGTPSSRVSEWLHGVTPRQATIRRIVEAAVAVDVLRGRTGGNLSALRSSLETPLPELGGSSPSQLIEQGRGAEIVKALGEVQPAADRETAERDLVEALAALAAAARRSADALAAARGT
jgi:hypothetical protein